MNEIGFSNEFRDLMLRHAALKERVANDVEMYMHFVNNVGPNIKARYMMLVGCLECTTRRLQTSMGSHPEEIKRSIQWTAASLSLPRKDLQKAEIIS